MADFTLTVFDAARASNGVNVTDNDTTVAASNNYYVPNNGRVVLIVTNAAGANVVTVETPGTVDGLAVTDLTANVAASKVHVLGPFPTQTYNDAQGRIKATFTAAADVMAVRVP